MKITTMNPWSSVSPYVKSFKNSCSDYWDKYGTIVVRVVGAGLLLSAAGMAVNSFFSSSGVSSDFDEKESISGSNAIARRSLPDAGKSNVKNFEIVAGPNYVAASSIDIVNNITGNGQWSLAASYYAPIQSAYLPNEPAVTSEFTGYFELRDGVSGPSLTKITGKEGFHREFGHQFSVGNVSGGDSPAILVATRQFCPYYYGSSTLVAHVLEGCRGSIPKEVCVTDWHNYGRVRDIQYFIPTSSGKWLCSYGFYLNAVGMVDLNKDGFDEIVLQVFFRSGESNIPYYEKHPYLLHSSIETFIIQGEKAFFEKASQPILLKNGEPGVIAVLINDRGHGVNTAYHLGDFPHKLRLPNTVLPIKFTTGFPAVAFGVSDQNDKGWVGVIRGKSDLFSGSTNITLSSECEPDDCTLIEGDPGFGFAFDASVDEMGDQLTLLISNPFKGGSSPYYKDGGQVYKINAIDWPSHVDLKNVPPSVDVTSFYYGGISPLYYVGASVSAGKKNEFMIGVGDDASPNRYNQNLTVGFRVSSDELPKEVDLNDPKWATPVVKNYPASQTAISYLPGLNKNNESVYAFAPSEQLNPCNETAVYFEKFENEDRRGDLFSQSSSTDQETGLFQTQNPIQTINFNDFHGTSNQTVGGAIFTDASGDHEFRHSVTEPLKNVWPDGRNGVAVGWYKSITRASDYTPPGVGPRGCVTLFLSEPDGQWVNHDTSEIDGKNGIRITTGEDHKLGHALTSGQFTGKNENCLVIAADQVIYVLRLTDEIATFGAEIDVSNWPAKDAVKIILPTDNPMYFVSIKSLDANGDGCQDLAIQASIEPDCKDDECFDPRIVSVKRYVIKGHKRFFDNPVIDLNHLQDEGVEIFYEGSMFYPDDAEFTATLSFPMIANAGNIDLKGCDTVVFGASGDSPAGRKNAGSVGLVFGHQQFFDHNVTIGPQCDGISCTYIMGGTFGGRFGSQISASLDGSAFSVSQPGGAEDFDAGFFSNMLSFSGKMFIFRNRQNWRGLIDVLTDDGSITKLFQDDSIVHNFGYSSTFIDPGLIATFNGVSPRSIHLAGYLVRVPKDNSPHSVYIHDVDPRYDTCHGQFGVVKMVDDPGTSWKNGRGNYIPKSIESFFPNGEAVLTIGSALAIDSSVNCAAFLLRVGDDLVSTPTPIPTPSSTPTPTATVSPTVSATPTFFASPSPSATVSPTVSSTPTVSPSPTVSAIPLTPTPSITASPSGSPTPTQMAPEEPEANLAVVLPAVLLPSGAAIFGAILCIFYRRQVKQKLGEVKSDLIKFFEQRSWNKGEDEHGERLLIGQKADHGSVSRV